MSVEPELLLQRADWIRHLAMHLALNAADADDLAQDTLECPVKLVSNEVTVLAL